MNKINLRPISKADCGFILQTHIRTAKDFFYNRAMGRKEFYASYSPVAVDLLSRSGGWVACDLEDPWLIYGYIFGQYDFRDTYIHGLYIKRDFRGMGIGRELLKKAMGNRGPRPIYTLKNNEAKKFEVDFDLWLPLRLAIKDPSTSQIVRLNEIVGYEGLNEHQISCLMNGLTTQL